MNQDIELFLAAQASDGEVQSEGEFTLAVEKAKERYLTFQEANPAYYFLRIFQAAVACGPSQIRVTFGKSLIVLWFPGSHPDLSPESVGRALEDPSCWDNSALGYLSVGLLCSYTAGAREVKWVQRRGEDVSALAFCEEGTRVAPASLSRDPEGCPGDFCLFSLKKPSTWIMSATAAEHAEALTRCQHAPLSVKLDGQSLVYTPGVPENDWCEGLTPARFLCQARFSQSDEPLVGYHALSPNLSVTFGSEGPLFVLCLPDLPISGELRIPLALTGKNTLVPVNSGVALDRLTLDEEGLGAEFVLHTELPVDLSGLAARESPELEALKSQLRETLALVRDHLVPHLETFHFELVPAWKETGSKALSGMAAAFSFGEFGLLATPVIAVGSVGLYAYNVQRRWKLGDIQTYLRTTVKERLMQKS